MRCSLSLAAPFVCALHSLSTVAPAAAISQGDANSRAGRAGGSLCRHSAHPAAANRRRAAEWEGGGGCGTSARTGPDDAALDAISGSTQPARSAQVSAATHRPVLAPCDTESTPQQLHTDPSAALCPPRSSSLTLSMAKSQYEYVKQFELSDAILPACWIVVRVDGVGFTKFTASHSLTKPNDARAMQLMNTAARSVCLAYPDIVIAQGMSDEYSFVIQPHSALYNRRSSKINSALTSLFTSSFVFHWPTFFPGSPLRPDNLPWFDGRCVAYPTDAIVKDYLRWRQVDVHINNLYNTCFWALVHDHLNLDPTLSEKEARERSHAAMNSSYASSAAKHELLFGKFGRNYNDEEAVWRKGSILVWTQEKEEADAESAKTAGQASTAVAASALASTSAAASASVAAASSSSASSLPSAAVPASSRAPSRGRVLTLLHCDLISDAFWTVEYPGIVPYRSPSQMKKEERAAEKAEKKAAHKRREKEERNKAAAEKSTEPAAAIASASNSVASTSAPSSAAACSPTAPSQPE